MYCGHQKDNLPEGLICRFVLAIYRQKVSYVGNTKLSPYSLQMIRLHSGVSPRCPCIRIHHKMTSPVGYCCLQMLLTSSMLSLFHNHRRQYVSFDWPLGFVVSVLCLLDCPTHIYWWVKTEVPIYAGHKQSACMIHHRLSRCHDRSSHFSFKNPIRYR